MCRTRLQYESARGKLQALEAADYRHTDTGESPGRCLPPRLAPVTDQSRGPHCNPRAPTLKLPDEGRRGRASHILYEYRRLYCNSSTNQTGTTHEYKFRDMYMYKDDPQRGP